MSLDTNRFEILKEQRRADYETWKPIYCRAINGEVIFNTKGFKHLRFNPNGTPRNPKEAMYKLGLLPLVRSVLQQATKIEEYRKQVVRINGSKKTLKEIEYWAIVAEVGMQKSKIRVILRKVGAGKIHFWSVMKLA